MNSRFHFIDWKILIELFIPIHSDQLSFLNCILLDGLFKKQSYRAKSSIINIPYFLVHKHIRNFVQQDEAFYVVIEVFPQKTFLMKQQLPISYQKLSGINSTAPL